MKLKLLLALLFCVSAAQAQSEQDSTSTPEEEPEYAIEILDEKPLKDEEIFVVVEEMPEFPGGED
ncbi:MAG: hypothetical protein LPK45_05835, partial [Bacteroidota bacterium]|nr:hypothetical protein [Bacteroidota bacterium]MDX5430587.1 hypothetical protein [Bacteroidota bacterium]MDX5469339.1 hypothetical protein [Bacteroidota bacterium]